MRVQEKESKLHEMEVLFLPGQLSASAGMDVSQCCLSILYNVRCNGSSLRGGLERHLVNDQLIVW